MSLKKLRNKIDYIDKSIVKLLNQRSEVILHIADFKRRRGSEIYAPQREQEIFKKIEGLSSGVISKDTLRAIYREIMSSSLKLEKGLKIAYLGPVASFSNIAALKKFGSQVNYIPCVSIADVFLKVERGESDYGVVPIENSVEGAINPVSYTHLRAHESPEHLVCRLLLENKQTHLSCWPTMMTRHYYT